VTGESFVYANWSSGEPNDAGSGEEALHVWSVNGFATWNDLNGASTGLLGYIVEFDAPGGFFTDPGAETWSATVDYDEGAGAQSLSLTGKTFSLSNLYEQDGVYDVEVCVTDDVSTGCNTAQVTVNNVAPSSVTASASPSTIDEDDSTTVSGSFADPGTLDTHTVVIE
jgi:hypothetical protein